MQSIKSSDVSLNNLIIAGPKKAGKTHLAHIYMNTWNATLLTEENFENIDYSKALVIDQLENFKSSEVRKLIINLVYYKTKSLILLKDIASINQYIADVSSRLKQMFLINIPKPDFEVYTKILQKLANDRGLDLPDSVAEFLFKRVNRSYISMNKCIERIDYYCCLLHRPPSVFFVSEIMHLL